MALLREETQKKAAGGVPSDASERAALARFGSAEDLADDLVFAWRSARRASRRSLLGAAALAFVLCAAVDAYFRLFGRFPPAHSLTEQWSQFVSSVEVCWVKSISIGLLAGTLFPRRGAAGVALGLTLWWIVSGPVREAIAIREQLAVWRPLEFPYLTWVWLWIGGFFRSPWALPAVLLGVGTALLAQRVKARRAREAAFR